MRYFLLFSIFILSACRQKPDMAYKLLEDWYFAVGDPANGLQVSTRHIPALDTLVRIPFRVKQPNTPLWFVTRVHLREDQLLYVNADDGSQVFYDQQQIYQTIPYGYTLTATVDSVTLAIRVLNNAMAGGLREARLYPLEAGLDYYQSREQQGHSLPGRYLLDTAFAQSVSASKADFRFTAWGDSQGGWDTFRQLTTDMARQHPDFSIGLGDLVSDGASKAQWQGFLEALTPLSSQTPVFPVIGNHDYDGYYDDLIPALYLRHIAPRNYFAWSYQNARFVALDPNETFPLGIKGQQRDWLLREMQSAAWKNAQWRFLLLHQPPYSAGWPGYHGDTFIREIVDEYAASVGIDFVLSGHSHCYERLSKDYGKQATHFIILGGAGGGLEPVENSDFPRMDTIIKSHHYGLFELDKEGVRLQVIGLDGAVLDQHTFRASH